LPSANKAFRALLGVEIIGSCLVGVVVIFAMARYMPQSKGSPAEQPTATQAAVAVKGLPTAKLIVHLALLSPTPRWVFSMPPTATATPLGATPAPSPSPLPVLALPPTATATVSVAVAVAQAAPDPIKDLSTLDHGPLDGDAQVQLYKVSLSFVAASPPEALQLAKKLNFVGRDGHPSNMCGPLSIAILRAAGLLPADTDSNPFWLLNPRLEMAQSLLARTFPATRFEHFSSDVPLNKLDWHVTPLQPADFLYLYAGPRGSFEHMLVVNRVDAGGRAFAVTNHNTANGFVVDEVLLYDPADPSAGIFATWTSSPMDKFGGTGSGGVELWRLREPP
jgi:hypothetical protein